MNQEKVVFCGETRYVKSISRAAPSLFKDLVKVEELIVDLVFQNEDKSIDILSYTASTYRIFNDNQLFFMDESNLLEIRIVIMAREFGLTDSYMYTVNLYSLDELLKFSIKLDWMSRFEK